MAHGELAPLKYTTSEDLIDEACREALSLNVTEVLGESPTVGRGKLYVVRGEYVARDRTVARICLSCQGRNQGRPAPIWQGSGSFEVTSIPMDVTAGKDKILDLVVFGPSGSELGVRMRLKLLKKA